MQEFMSRHINFSTVKSLFSTVLSNYCDNLPSNTRQNAGAPARLLDSGQLLGKTKDLGELIVDCDCFKVDGENFKN